MSMSGKLKHIKVFIRCHSQEYFFSENVVYYHKQNYYQSICSEVYFHIPMHTFRRMRLTYEICSLKGNLTFARKTKMRVVGLT